MPPKKVKSQNRKPKKESVWVLQKELKPDHLECPSDIFAVIASRGSKQQDTRTQRLVLDAACTTDSSGQIANVYKNDPSVCGNWSSYAAVNDEYRVLAMRVSFKPNYITGGSAATILAPIAVAIDYDSSAAMTGYTLVGVYSSQKEIGGGRPWSKTALMSGSADSGFISCQSPGPTYWIKMWSAGNPVSTTIGRFVIDMAVQFRGQGI